MSEINNNLKYEDSKFSIESAVLKNVEGAVDASTGKKNISIDSNTIISGDATILGKVDIQGATYTLQENPEWIKVLTDAQDRIIAGVRKDGSVYINKIEGLEETIQAAIEEYITDNFTNKSTTDKFSESNGKLMWDGSPIASETSISTLVVDLPVSDGTDIESGYAYIDSTNRTIKVKA